MGLWEMDNRHLQGLDGTRIGLKKKGIWKHPKMEVEEKDSPKKMGNC